MEHPVTSRNDLQARTACKIVGPCATAAKSSQSLFFYKPLRIPTESKEKVPRSQPRSNLIKQNSHYLLPLRFLFVGAKRPGEAFFWGFKRAAPVRSIRNVRRFNLSPSLNPAEQLGRGKGKMAPSRDLPCGAARIWGIHGAYMVLMYKDIWICIKYLEEYVLMLLFIYQGAPHHIACSMLFLVYTLHIYKYVCVESLWKKRRSFAKKSISSWTSAWQQSIF